MCYIEITDTSPAGDRFAIQDLTKDHIYILLQGLYEVVTKIAVHPTDDNIKFLEDSRRLIKILEQKS